MKAPSRLSQSAPQLARSVVGGLLCIVAFIGVFVGLLGLISFSIYPASSSVAPIKSGFFVTPIAAAAAYLVLRERAPLWLALLGAVCLAGIGAGASTVVRAAIHDWTSLLGRPGIVALICLVLGSLAGWKGQSRRAEQTLHATPYLKP